MGGGDEEGDRVIIQSLSVVVPNNGCINSCRFCVSRMHKSETKNQMDGNLPFFDLYLRDYLKRLEFCRDNGVNTLILTGDSEPQQNRRFLVDFGLFMMLMDRPFRKIEMQTTGALLDENYLRFLRNHVGVNTIALSVSSFNDKENVRIINGGSIPIRLSELCEKIKKYDFNIRLCLNLNAAFDSYSPKEIFERARRDFFANQITFRFLYSSGKDTDQDRWINDNLMSPVAVEDIREYIKANGASLGRLEYGQEKYSVRGISTVLDDDCMAKEIKQEMKYLILRPDCKLYSRWDDEASLIF